MRQGNRRLVYESMTMKTRPALGPKGLIVRAVVIPIFGLPFIWGGLHFTGMGFFKTCYLDLTDTCICSVQSGQFANCAAQSAIQEIRICLVCKLCQSISFHNVKTSNVGRQQSEVLTIDISMNTFRKRQLPLKALMLVSCHNLCRTSTFNTRYFSRNQ